jgi:cysteine-S-conjugate beta-lyase
MKYDFDTVCDRRNTGCAKWGAVKEIFGREDVIPMWVADMDFPTAPPIVEALKTRAAHPFYGYTMPSPSLTSAVVDRMKRRYDWIIEPEWVVFTPGIIPALNVAVRALSRPGDDIILQEPVYYPFFGVVQGSGCRIAHHKLKLSRGRYTMDFTDLEAKFKPEGRRLDHTRIKALILCNPQNPIGRVWSKDELVRLGEIVIKNGAVVVSDEIHCELLYNGYKHTPFASISPEFAQSSIVCMAPSKTFNLPGLEASSIIIPNKKLRDSFNDVRSGLVHGVNLFGLTAMEAAYRYGDDWLSQLLDYLQGNLEITMDWFKERIPRIKVIAPQGTYLLWLDCRGLKLDDLALQKFMREQARVGFDDGFMFGEGGSGFQRMNIACPRSLLREALGRIEQSVRAL